MGSEPAGGISYTQIKTYYEEKNRDKTCIACSAVDKPRHSSARINPAVG